MRNMVLLVVSLLVAGCGGPRAEPAADEPADDVPTLPTPSSQPPKERIVPLFLNDTFSLELFAYRNAVSYSYFNNAANCVKVDGRQLVEFTGVATWSPTSEFTRNLRVALVTDAIVNETEGPSPLEFQFFADLVRMAATPRQVGVLLESEGVAVKQPVVLELSVRSMGDAGPTASSNPCPVG